MDQGIYQDLLSTKSRWKWIYRGAVEDLSMAKITSMDWESVKKLSGRQRAQKIGSMDRRSCREEWSFFHNLIDFIWTYYLEFMKLYLILAI